MYFSLISLINYKKVSFFIFDFSILFPIDKNIVQSLILYFLLQIFRDHNIDGSSLPLLTEDHLTLRLGMKLGPALKLKSIISKKLGPANADVCCEHCSHCQAIYKSNQGNNSVKGAQHQSNFPTSNSFDDQKQSNFIQKSELNVGGQHSFPINPSLMQEHRKSPSESSNVSTGNTPVTDIKEEPSGRSSQNSNSAENKNE